MAASAGDLHVKLSADIAEFRADMNRARDEMFKMQTAAVAAGAAIGEFVVRGADAAVRFVQETIAMRANLDDLADATGESVQNLDGLRRAAEISGVEFGRTQAGLLKFTKSLNESGAEAKASTQALQAIGLSVEELRARRPAEAMLEVAKALGQFEDGAGKVSVATALMGKEGAAMLPFFKDLAEQGELAGKITAQQVAEAKRLQVEWRRLKQEGEGLKATIADVLIPAFADLIEQFRIGIKEAGGFWAALQRFGQINPFRSLDSNIDNSRAKLESLSLSRDIQLARGNSGTAAVIGEKIEAESQRLKFLELQRRQEMRGPAADPQSPYFEFAGGQRQQLDFRPESEAKAALEKRDRHAAEYARALKMQNDMLDEAVRLGAKFTLEQDAKLQKEREHLSLLATRSEEAYLLAQERAMIERDTLTRNAALEQIKLNKVLEKQNDIGRELGMTFKSAFEDAIVNGRRFSEVLKGIGQDIALIVVRRNITDPLADAISKGAGSLFKELFRAEGGPVSGGQPYIVGERGPELIVPGMSGTVIPNHALNALPVNFSTAQPAPASNTTIIADLRGADVAAVARLEQFVAKMNATLDRRAVAAVANAGMRGRSFG